jgi:hypothetical protein
MSVDFMGVFALLLVPMAGIVAAIYLAIAMRRRR